ncbi:GPI mannosyltransferase 3, putative [Plasmodium ovale]|uniref:Mannosyltransferase n=1 Tax=Plasmodium ovale TaxID=36330 RepID=A0A1D3TK55_PLAOA|nr:GPI mannosyltransferase 3, putative [Plasmodium ovale]
MIYGDFLKRSERALSRALNSKNCLFFLILFRIFNCLFVRTSFFPDEYAQSVEIAHYWVFGYGHMPWEWEPCVSLRSVIHPFMYAILYYILKITKLDSPFCVVYTPKIFQGICAAFGDYVFIKLINLWYVILYMGKKKGERDNPICTILICYFSCWFHFYCICRTSSHSFECLFNIWGVYFLSKNYYPLVALREDREEGGSNERSTGGGSRVWKDATNEDNSTASDSHIWRDDTNEDNSTRGGRRIWRDTLKRTGVYSLFHIETVRYNGKINPLKRKNLEHRNDSYISSGNESVDDILGEPKINDFAGTWNVQTSCYGKTHYDLKAIETLRRGFHIKNLLLSLFCSSICVLMRPNAALFWLCIYFLYFIKNMDSDNKLKCKEILIIGCLYTILFLMISIVVDSYYYGKITLSFYNFFLYNFVSGENSFFGEHSFHFYFLCVIPSIYLTLTPFTYYYSCVRFYQNMIKRKKHLFGMIRRRIDYTVYLATFLELFSLSFSKHKEHKLIIGYIPFLTIYTGRALHGIWKNVESTRHIVAKEENDKGKYMKKKKRNFFFFFLVNLSLFLNAICILFFSVIHNSSPEKVTSHFRNLKTRNDKDVTILITDCYDIPLYSHIHRKFKIGFFDCSPHIKKKDGKIIYNWRKRIYDSNFGSIFYDIFDINKKESNSIDPYIIPNKSFYWFGHTHFNPKKVFQFDYEKINFACMEYRFSKPLNGDLPLYIVTSSVNLQFLNNFLKKFNYYLDTEPIFSHFVLKEGIKIEAVNHYIFKRILNS